MLRCSMVEPSRHCNAVTPHAGEMQLTQPLDGTQIGNGAEGRGLQDVPAYNDAWLREGEAVAVAMSSGECASQSEFPL